MSVPAPGDPEFNMWVRDRALTAAARITAGRAVSFDHRPDVAAAYVLRLAKQLEHYLLTGESTPRR